MRPTWISLISAGSAVCVGTAGLLVLIGWAQDIEILKRIQPGFTAMNPLTAFCFVLSAVSILLKLTARCRAAFGVSSAIAALALLKIIDITLFPVPVDRTLFAHSVLGEAGMAPNSMAPNTAVAILLVGLCLALSSARQRWTATASQVLAAAVLLISMFALIGYGFGMNRLNTVGVFIPMAVHTALVLLILSAGLLSLRADRGILLVLRSHGAAGSMARTVLPLALLIPIAVGAIRLWGQQQGYYGLEGGVALQVIANVLITLALLISSILALHRSDTVRLQREQALARSEEQYRLAEIVAQVGHWRIEVPSRSVTWSDEVFRICGLSKAAGVPNASDMLDVYHPDDRDRFRESVRAALRDGHDWQGQLRLCRPDGEVRHVISQGICERDADGNTTSVFGVFADVTELEKARRQAEAATAAKASFLANMSHDIRTPMNGVLGFTELLAATPLDAEQQRHVQLIGDSGRAMMRLLNDILDLSKIDSGQMPVTVEPVDLAHNLRNCVRLMEPIANGKGVDLTLEVDPALPRWVLGDPMRLRQILLNLIGNAAKFTDHGTIAVHARQVGDTLSIEVADSGVGIPADRLEIIFEQFSQGDASIAHKYGGTGLGLSISAELTKLMGGSIAVTSVPGEGATFTITLPLIEAIGVRDAEAGSERDVEAVIVGRSGVSPRILIAEDHDINQVLITALARSVGLEPVIASNGEEAIAMVRASADASQPFGLVLMDMQMPLIDGLEATRRLRALGFTADQLPIVALTASAYAEDRAACLAAGMQGHVAKPVKLRDLKALAARYFGAASTVATDRAEPLFEPVITSLADRYRARKTETLEAISAEARRQHSDGATIKELASMLHKLAGTAGFFGDAPLGDVASRLEQDLNRAAPDAWSDVLAKGWESLRECCQVDANAAPIDKAQPSPGVGRSDHPERLTDEPTAAPVGQGNETTESPVETSLVEVGAIGEISTGVHEPSGAETPMIDTNGDATAAESVTSVQREQGRFRAAIQAVQGVLWTNDPAGRMVGEQPGWAALTGQGFAEYQDYGWASVVHPEDAQPTVDAWNEAVAERRTFVFEHRVRRHDGVWRLFGIRAVPLLDPTDGSLLEWVGVHTDITNQREAEEQLRATNVQLEQIADEFGTLVEGMSELCWMAQPDGHIYWYNHRWYDYTGTVAADMEGWGWQSVHDPDTLPAVIERWSASINSGKAFEMTFPLRGADGTFRPFLTRVSPVRDAEGKVRRWLGINIDVTEAQKINAELERRVDIRTAALSEMARQLEAACNAAEEASRAKSRFLAGMSHELRTPLNGVLGYAQLLRMEGGLTVSQSARIEAMLNAGNHLLGMITSVLDISEIEAGHQALRLEEINLPDIAGECLDMVAFTAEEKRLSLDLSIGRAVPRTLITDPTRLRQVLLNLLGNAAKFTTEGSIELRLRRSSTGEGLRIEVADTGPGIPPELQTRLFHEFERLNTRANARIEGSGLGLAFSARLVTLLGGRIGYDDRPGGGSVFWIELPLAVGDVPSRAAASQTRLRAPADTARQVRVLVTDDVEINREIAQAFLQTAGHQVTCVTGGAEAVAAAAADDFDVILMDVSMPEVDGLEATRRIRNLPGPRGSRPIIGVTAHAFADQIADCLNAGMNSHLAKPFTYEGLSEAVTRAL